MMTETGPKNGLSAVAMLPDSGSRTKRGGILYSRRYALASRLSVQTLSMSVVAAVMSLAAPLGAQDVAHDSIPSYDTLTVRSHALGETRRINVHEPRSYTLSANSRFPVLYMPDGGIDEDFPHIVHTVDSLIAIGAIRPVIIVGVPNTERRRDLTGPTRVASDSAIATHVGGSSNFRRFLGDELIPVIDARYRTSPERAIVGESLAGLFVVETFLREPAMFTHYIAFDPSLWWNRGALVDSAAVLLSRVAATAAAPPGRLNERRRTIYIADSRDDIADAAARFGAALEAAAMNGWARTFVPRPDLTHGTIFRAMAPDALRSALR
jgi:predicted alpha/beta superfamily hydrolase